MRKGLRYLPSIVNYIAKGAFRGLQLDFEINEGEQEAA